MRDRLLDLLARLMADGLLTSDEADTLDFEHLQACTRTALETVRMVASGELDPAWTAGHAPKSR